MPPKTIESSENSAAQSVGPGESVASSSQESFKSCKSFEDGSSTSLVNIDDTSINLSLLTENDSDLLDLHENEQSVPPLLNGFENGDRNANSTKVIVNLDEFKSKEPENTSLQNFEGTDEEDSEVIVNLDALTITNKESPLNADDEGINLDEFSLVSEQSKLDNDDGVKVYNDNDGVESLDSAKEESLDAANEEKELGDLLDKFMSTMNLRNNKNTANGKAQAGSNSKSLRKGLTF